MQNGMNAQGKQKPPVRKVIPKQVSQTAPPDLEEVAGDGKWCLQNESLKREILPKARMFPSENISSEIIWLYKYELLRASYSSSISLPVVMCAWQKGHVIVMGFWLKRNLIHGQAKSS